MRKLLFLIALILTSCSASKSIQSEDRQEQENIIIFYEPDAGSKTLIKEAEKYGSKILYVYQNFNGIAITVPQGKSVKEAIDHFKKLKGVLSVTEDKKIQLD